MELRMLTASEGAALRNLADKKSGSLTAFVNIADARRLTELRLAERSRQGWDITAAGAAYLATLDPLPASEPQELHLARARLSLAPRSPEDDAGDHAGARSEERSHD
jgi:hypothetical protein